MTGSMLARLPFFCGWVAVALGCSVLSAMAIWLAAPRKVRAVAGRIGRLA